MLKIQVKLAPWDKAYDFIAEGLELVVGEVVVVKVDSNLELAEVINVSHSSQDDDTELPVVIRKAEPKDIARRLEADRRKKTITDCQDLISRHGLEMKLVDVQSSLDGGRLNFAFTSEGRVDFRDLVKDLSAYFNAAIRLTQIGSRDEAKILGDCGSCGLKLCCQGALPKFCSITSEMAEAQQVVNRGSDRISGMCGRLKCCLSFEYEGYKYLEGNLPPCGTRVNVDGVRGVIVQHHILKQTVDVKIADQTREGRDTIIEVDINRHKKKK